MKLASDADRKLHPVPHAEPAYPGCREQRRFRDLVVTLLAGPVTLSLCVALLLSAPAQAGASDGTPSPTLHRPASGSGALEALETAAGEVAPAPCRGRIVIPAPEPEPPCRGDVVDPRILPAPPRESPACLAQVARDPASFDRRPVDLEGTLTLTGSAGYAITGKRPSPSSGDTAVALPLRLSPETVKAAKCRVGGPIRVRGTFRHEKGESWVEGQVATPGN